MKTNCFESLNSNEESQKKILLQEFVKVADRATPPFSTLRGIKYVLGEWIFLNVTAFLQQIGYEKKKILSFRKREKLILNIGSNFNINVLANEHTVNCDLVPCRGIFSMLKMLFGGYKIDYDLFVDITHYDKNLLDSADNIILSHVLEHIHPQLAIKALKNCFAYLKQGGCIRITVPFLGTYEQLDFPLCQDVYNRTLAKNRLVYDHGHQLMYDVELLTLLMEEVGFSDVKEVTFGEGLMSEMDLLEHKLESIYLTGLKA